MRHLLAVPLVAATLVVPAALPAAEAAPLRKSCNLISDPPGDVYMIDSRTNMKSGALDIQSVDVATGRSKVVVVLRMVTTSVTNDNAVVNGASWAVDMQFSGSTSQHKFSKKMKRPAEGGAVTYTFELDNKVVPGVTGGSDGTTITWTLPKSAIPALRKPKTSLVKLFASTLGLMTHDYAPDGGSYGNVKYQDMQPSCVKAS